VQLGYPGLTRDLPPAVAHPALPLGKEKMRELQAYRGDRRKLRRAQLREHTGALSLFES
jgi:hypothetical protein